MTAIGGNLRYLRYLQESLTRIMAIAPREFYKLRQREYRIKLLSHNVFWFQGHPFATDQPPAPRREIMERLCAIYCEMAPDIICLQELQNEAAAQSVSELIGMPYVFRAGGSFPQYGGAIFSNHPMQVFPLTDAAPDRVLISAKVLFPGGDSLHIVNVHLPSNRQRGSKEGQLQRLREVSWIAKDADILMGDYNESPQGQCAAFLRTKRYIDAAEFCAAGQEASNVRGFSGGRGDQIWVHCKRVDDLQAYFVIPKEQISIDDSLEEKYLSDHLPIGCLIK